ncbi:hypothetical protein QC764_0044480 [Podospora pseudoanserina]|uniref:Uncharacterized protein n=1 Tax=Podospora pseudoanserina TaxID=2609844 RepID=A0ABR0IJB7_9PEZI|nr:hypothetical protein QC764_0044480 [Podospora pseudoanserina]
MLAFRTASSLHTSICLRYITHPGDIRLYPHLQHRIPTATTPHCQFSSGTGHPILCWQPNPGSAPPQQVTKAKA